jgi:multidrug efflux system outer membrane protein
MRAAMEAYRGTVLFAFAEVEDGLANYRYYTEQRGVQEQRVAALSRVLELSETRYEGGVAEYLEVLDAQRELFDAELEQAETVQAQLVSLTRLYKALGGGWTLAEAGPCLPPPLPSPPAPVAGASAGLPPPAPARAAPPAGVRAPAPALVVPPPPPPPPLPR